MADQGRMTSRERVIDSIMHKEPDRIPIDMGSTPSSGISAIAYHNLKEYLGLTEGHTRVYEVVQQLAQPEDDIITHFGIDILDIGRMFNTREEDWYDIALPDGPIVQFPSWFRPVCQSDGVLDVFMPDGIRIATMPRAATWFDQTYFPYLDGYPEDYEKLSEAMGKVLWAVLAPSPWDNADQSDFWQQLRQKTIALHNSSAHALMIVVGCNLFEWGTFLRRIDNFLMDLVENPVEVERFLDALMEQHLATLEKVCQAVGDVADIIRFADDLGTDQGPFMSPKIYQKLFKPRHTVLCDYVKKHSKMYTFLHSCGSIYMLIPYLIEAGFEIINPVQITSRDMEPERLKREFGRDITFWGGCDTRHVLNRARPGEVKEHVRRLLEIFSPGGGFVFNTVHNILPDVPPENIVAMFEAVNEFNNSELIQKLC
jgi:uroporphyrinogen decarboxylase